ncbi:hypothetical protein HDU90_007714 [Geranomyces variabilis]|nr:hypothetical protein HDU90_007714 [Geranomyces variabilis]
MAKNVDNESLTRWGATPENADNDEPLTRWGPPEPQRPQKGPADRYLNITTGPAGIQYSVGSSNAQNNSFDSGNDAAVAVSAEWDADPNSNGEGASDEEVVGWDDTVFLPVDITIRSLKDDLVEIAQEHGVSIDYKDNTLRIRADTQDQLCTARNKVDILVTDFRPRVVRTAKAIPKAPRPGVWGQPRQEHAKNGQYKALGD